jgi:2-keto-3-deoxy-L-rhamnonate aldolase RhmA
VSAGSFAERLRAGELLVGTFLSSASPAIASVIADGGLDWLVVDAEHGVPDLHGASLCVQVALPRLPALVRVPPGDRRTTEALLDAGAAGVVLPRVDSVEAARAFVALTRYGDERGFARAVPRFRWGTDTSDPLAADATVARVVQIETAGALADAEEIARLDGVDALFLGPNDLALDLRRHGLSTGPDEAAELVVAAARAAGKAAGTLLGDAVALGAWVERGYRLLAVSGDVRFVAEGVRSVVETAAGLSGC